MTYEAIVSGLKMEPFAKEWKENGDNESLTGVWKLLEIIPFRRLNYKDATSTTHV
jgi:hypothetical protein